MYTVLYEKNLHDKHGHRVDALCRPQPFFPYALIIIDVDREDQEGLLAHELEHYRQHLATLTLHPILYNTIKRYRLWAEVRAHKKQLEYCEDRTEQAFKYAISIANDYDLDVAPIEVFRMLTDDN